MSREFILTELTSRIFSPPHIKSGIFIDQFAILIEAQSPSYFQECFRKCKSQLNNLINFAPAVSIEFFDAIKPLFKYDTIYNDILILTLKKSIYQSDIEIRKVGLYGVVSLLTTTKPKTSSMSSSQASQTISQSQISQSQMSNISQYKFAEKYCLEVFANMSRCLSQQSDIRSKLYQVLDNVQTNI